MAKKNTLALETKAFEELVTKLEGIKGDVKQAVTDALEQSAETIEYDTKDAMQKANLPAKGKYSTGRTAETIVEGAKAKWTGTTAEINAGFDYSKPGSGGLLITGTPRMQPNRELNRIYKQKKYMKQIEADMAEVVNDYITEAMKGD